MESADLFIQKLFGLNKIMEVCGMREVWDLEKVFQIGTQVGTHTAMEILQREHQKQKQEKQDRRLYNTELLLRNYRKLLIHKNDTIYSYQRAKQVFQEIDESVQEENTYCDSLTKSAEKAAVIVAHIGVMLDGFRYLAEKDILRPELLSGYKILKSMYIEEPRSIDELLDQLLISQATFYRHRKVGIEFLTTLIFGADSIRFK